MTSETYRLLGGPGSPFSLKMRAILRYRRLPHHWIVPRSYIGSDSELKTAGKRMIPVLQYPDGNYWADSTPLAYELEQRHPGQRSIVPDDPGTAFLSHLIDDLGDEMLCSAMFDMRWGSPQDQAFCARRQMSGWLSPLPREELDAIVGTFTQRQTGLRELMVQAQNHEILQALYRDTLQAMEEMLDRTPYLFGTRPSLGDFGLYGQLSQCAIDPTANGIMRQTAPRTFQWTQSLDDACGVDGEWLPHKQWSPAVTRLLQVAARYYLPMMVANAQAALNGEKTYTTAIAGWDWQGRVERYKVRCLGWLMRDLSQVPDASLQWLRPLLQTTGCWDALHAVPQLSTLTPPMAPE